MIVHSTAGNNLVRFQLLLMLSLLMAATLLISACEKGNSNSTGETKVNSDAVAELCHFTVDDSAWWAFMDLNKMTEEGISPTREQFQVYVDLPIISLWSSRVKPPTPPSRLNNWLGAAFLNSDDYAKTGKKNMHRRHFKESFRYSMEHSQEISSRLKDFKSEGYYCELRKKIDFWISAEVVPDSLVVAFVPGKPEIRILENYLFVDTGVFNAGSFDQLTKQLAGIIYRSTMILEGDAPLASQGELAVANLFRTMMNEGIIDIIQDKPNTSFAASHPKLADVNIVPEIIFDHARDAISLMNLHLPQMLIQQSVMQEKGYDLAKTLKATASIIRTGYSMSATIVARFGEARLRATAGEPALWLAAYQEAALMNPSPTPATYETPDELHLCLPPFNDEVYPGLIKLLSRNTWTEKN